MVKEESRGEQRVGRKVCRYVQTASPLQVLIVAHLQTVEQQAVIASSSGRGTKQQAGKGMWLLLVGVLMLGLAVRRVRT